MKILRTAPLIVLMSVVAATGCGRKARREMDFGKLVPRREMDFGKLVRDYDRIWQATGTVMSRHFQVTWTDKSEGVIKAKPLRNDGKMGSAEMRVSARIVPSPTGGFDVEVRAVNYIEVSEPRALSKKTARYEWLPVSFDKRLETQLLNEIDDVRFEGARAGSEMKFMASPKELVPTMPGKRP